MSKFYTGSVPGSSEKNPRETYNRNSPEVAQDKMILDILERSSEHLYEPTFDELEVRYDRLYQLLKPIIIVPERPLYMKKED